MRVARWSRRNRLASTSGSVSTRSSEVMKSSWRTSRFWLRRPRLTKLSAMLRRSTACSTARPSAVSCTVLRAWATSTTSSLVFTRTGSTWGTATSSPSGVWSTSITARGRRSPAIALAWAVSDRSGRVMDRETSHVSTKAATTDATASPMNSRSRMRASATRSSAVWLTSAASSSRSSFMPPQLVVVSGSISSGDRHQLPGHRPLDQAGEALVELRRVGVVDHPVIRRLRRQQRRVVPVPQHLAGGGRVDLVAVVDAPVAGAHDEVHAGHVHEQLDGAAGGVDQLGARPQRLVVDRPGDLVGGVEQRPDHGDVAVVHLLGELLVLRGAVGGRRGDVVVDVGPQRLQPLQALEGGGEDGRHLGARLLGLALEGGQRLVGVAPGLGIALDRGGDAEGVRPDEVDRGPGALALQLVDEAPRGRPRPRARAACWFTSSAFCAAALTSTPTTATKARRGTARAAASLRRMGMRRMDASWRCMWRGCAPTSERQSPRDGVTPAIAPADRTPIIAHRSDGRCACREAC